MKRFDAIVVGAGATGGWAAMVLARSGMQVLVIDAGPDPTRGAVGRGCPDRQPIQRTCFAYTPETSGLFVDDVTHPYAVPKGRPFRWIRSRVLGGRSLLWAGHSYRLSEYDLQAPRIDGVPAWPLAYRELAPHYDRVERFLGVRGTVEGVPSLPDGRFLPAASLSSSALLFRQRLEQARRGWRAVPARRAQRTARGWRQVLDGRFAAGGPACDLKPTSLSCLDLAMRTGRLTVWTGTVVSHLINERDRPRVAGVACLQVGTGRSREARARVVLLCGSTIESTRIMMHSRDIAGAALGTRSGALGHFLHDHLAGIHVHGLRGLSRRRAPERIQRDLLYVPRWPGQGARRSFIGGYGVQAELVTRPIGRQRGAGTASLTLLGFGEVIPRRHNRLRLNLAAPDADGLPGLEIDCRYGTNEQALARDISQTMRSMLAAAGFELVTEKTTADPPGQSIHELGTARMGRDPRSSVLDPFNRCWEASNLFVTDGACFPAGANQNPTLTMMALTDRACHHIVRLGRRCEL
jgi:choline dehydrogenase-like flavoprotein